MPSGDGAPILSQPDDETSPQGPAAANDDLSARLDLIRSVVGASEGYDEDEHAQDFADATGAQPLAWDDAESAPDEPAMSEAGPAGTAGPVAEDEAQDMSPTGPDEPDQAVPGDAQADSEFEDTLAALLADAAPVDAQAAPDAPDAAVAETGDRRAARVVKVSRADLEAARAHDLMATGSEAGEDLGEVAEITDTVAVEIGGVAVPGGAKRTEHRGQIAEIDVAVTVDIRQRARLAERQSRMSGSVGARGEQSPRATRPCPVTLLVLGTIAPVHVANP